jgi:predicted Ser/Thr protein kinase
VAVNVKGLELVGKGHHGKVYRLDNNRCIKIYKKKAFLKMEYEVLKHSERFPYFPKVYECKENYMIREYIEGPNLWDYIKQHGLSMNMTLKLLELIDSFIELQYSKQDCHLHHIIVTGKEQLRMIDPTTNMSRKSSYPRTLLSQLHQLGWQDQFFKYTKEFRPDYYDKWRLHSSF